jgi:hypothetical protein
MVVATYTHEEVTPLYVTKALGISIRKASLHYDPVFRQKSFLFGRFPEIPLVPFPRN